MIESLVPIKIPPGLVMNGTLKERAGRWMDGNLVRWGEGGVVRPVGGWTTQGTSPSLSSGVPRGAFAWGKLSNGATKIILGTSTAVYAVEWSGLATLTAEVITPAGGPGSAAGGYSFATKGDDLFFMRSNEAGSDLWKWNGLTGGAATEVTEYDTQYPVGGGVVFTPQAFLVALVGRTIAWADQDNPTIWIPSGVNSAGSLPLLTPYQARRGLVVGGQTLIFTDGDLWELEYIGGDLIHGLRPVADACGLSSADSVVAVQNTAYWMGHNSFFVYDGFVRELECDIAEHIFSDISRDYWYKWFAVQNATFNEIWWFYTSAGVAGEPAPDRVAIYNYVEKTWSKGTLSRAAGTHAVLPTFQQSDVVSPVMFDLNRQMYEHELPTAPTGAYIESGPILAGSRRSRVQKAIPDGAQAGDAITLFYADEWGSAESSTLVSPVVEGKPLDVRIDARYVRLKQELNDDASRVGIPELGVIQSSLR